MIEPRAELLLDREDRGVHRLAALGDGLLGPPLRASISLPVIVIPVLAPCGCCRLDGAGPGPRPPDA